MMKQAMETVFCFCSESSPRPALQNARDRPREAHQRRRGADAPLHQRVVRRKRSERGMLLPLSCLLRAALTDIVCLLNFQPPPGAWDHTVDEREHTVEQWKELIYQVENETGSFWEVLKCSMNSYLSGSH